MSTHFAAAIAMSAAVAGGCGTDRSPAPPVAPSPNPPAASDTLRAAAADAGRLVLPPSTVSRGCYCPAAKCRAVNPGDSHCYCTRGTHQAAWETAPGRPVDVKIVDTVRRGGKTCHFVVTL